MSKSTLTLPAKLRSASEKPRSLRRERRIPAVVYGAKTKSLPLTLELSVFRKVLREAGESTIIDLTIEDGHKTLQVLVHDVTYDPITNELEHIDFLHVDMAKKISAHVPLKFEGLAPAVKNLGGILTHTKTELEIRCLPADLPHDIIVDVSSLETIHASIHVKDLSIDRTKIEILSDETAMVCSVLAPKTVEELDAELATPVGETVSEETKAAGEAEKAEASARKESDTEKKGKEK